MVEAVNNNGIASLQQTLRQKGMGRVLVIKPGQATFKGVESLKRLPNLYEKLAGFISQKFGIQVVDILSDVEGLLPILAADPSFMERISNSGGNLEVLGHTVVWEMENETSGKLYLLKNDGNIKDIRTKDGIPDNPPPPNPAAEKASDPSAVPADLKRQFRYIIEAYHDSEGFRDKWGELMGRVDDLIKYGITTEADLKQIIGLLCQTNKNTPEGQREITLQESKIRLLYEKKVEGEPELLFEVLPPYRLYHPTERLFVLDEQGNRKWLYTFIYRDKE